MMADQRVALVTGATGLLGRQVIKAFAQAGWKAIGTGFTRANPPSILKVDLGDDVAVENVLDETLYAASHEHISSVVPRHLQSTWCADGVEALDLKLSSTVGHILILSTATQFRLSQHLLTSVQVLPIVSQTSAKLILPPLAT